MSPCGLDRDICIKCEDKDLDEDQCNRKCNNVIENKNKAGCLIRVCLVRPCYFVVAVVFIVVAVVSIAVVVAVVAGIDFFCSFQHSLIFNRIALCAQILPRVYARL